MKNIIETIEFVVKNDIKFEITVNNGSEFKFNFNNTFASGSATVYQDSTSIIYTDGETKILSENVETLWEAGAASCVGVEESIKISNATIVAKKHLCVSTDGKEVTEDIEIFVDTKETEILVRGLYATKKVDYLKQVKEEKKNFFHSQVKRAIEETGIKRDELMHILNVNTSKGGWNFIHISHIVDAAKLYMDIKGYHPANFPFGAWYEAERWGIGKGDTPFKLDAVNQIFKARLSLA